MTLFIKMPRREFEISDLYVIALSFGLFFAVGKVVKKVIEKQNQYTNIQMPNPIGGGIEFQVSDDHGLGLTILSCIADNEGYLVKSPKVIKLIFGLVKETITDDLVITPNMMRFLALNLIKNDQSLIAKIGNVVVLSNNRARLFTRTSGAVVFGLVGAVFSTLTYAIFMVLLYFDLTQNCGYKCEDYFEHLPQYQDQPVRIYTEKLTGNLAIVGNDDARQIQIYTPLKASDEIIISSTGEAKVTKNYKKSRKKAKQVKFSDFKKKDPVLSTFKDLEEPFVPQNLCPINDIHDIRIDG